MLALTEQGKTERLEAAGALVRAARLNYHQIRMEDRMRGSGLYRSGQRQFEPGAAAPQ